MAAKKPPPKTPATAEQSLADLLGKDGVKLQIHKQQRTDENSVGGVAELIIDATITAPADTPYIPT